MQADVGPQKPRKFLAFALFVLLCAVFGSAGILVYLGAFSPVRVDMIQAPPYRLVYLDHRGPYDQIDSTIEKVHGVLRAAAVPAEDAFALFYDDPSVVASSELRSEVGYLVEEIAYVPEPLKLRDRPAQQVVRATFEGSALLGSFKAYRAIKEWASDHGYGISLPALEIYHPDGQIEYHLPIQRQSL